MLIKMEMNDKKKKKKLHLKRHCQKIKMVLLRFIIKILPKKVYVKKGKTHEMHY